MIRFDQNVFSPFYTVFIFPKVFIMLVPSCSFQRSPWISRRFSHLDLLQQVPNRLFSKIICKFFFVFILKTGSVPWDQKINKCSEIWISQSKVFFWFPWSCVIDIQLKIRSQSNYLPFLCLRIFEKMHSQKFQLAMMPKVSEYSGN